VRHEGNATTCVLTGVGTVCVSPFVGGFLRSGDEIEFSSELAVPVAKEVRIRRADGHRLSDLYSAPIAYVSQPRQDKRQELFLRAEVADGALSIRSIHLPAAAVRDYFYKGDRHQPWDSSPTLYELLQVPASASPGDLRLAYKLRRLELQSSYVHPSKLRDTERAFNILMQPNLRACYDTLLRDSEAPVLFPYSGFGALLTEGEMSRDRTTFFARRILSFLPDRRQRRFRARLRQVDFLHEHAVYRDSRRKLEIVLDPVVLPLTWDATWNRWKHLLPTKVGVEGVFIATGKYRLRCGEWELLTWSSALPSRLTLTLPADVTDQIQAAKKTHHRFGQYSAALDMIRIRLETEPLDGRELDRICADLGIPADFDVTQISWRPDYDRFFYDQLSKRARRVYLFRGDYIMELEHAVVVEVPQVGHATYVFAKPPDLDLFVRMYARVTKDDIRRNRDGIAERLGFLGRVAHGPNGRTWLRDLKLRIGEPVDYALALE
jgi:hypothetical protein